MFFVRFIKTNNKKMTEETFIAAEAMRKRMICLSKAIELNDKWNISTHEIINAVLVDDNIRDSFLSWLNIEYNHAKEEFEAL